MAEAKERAWSRIHRADGQRAVTVQGDVDRDLSDAQELLVQARAEFIPGLLERYPGLRLDVEGDSKESAKTGQSIGCNVLLGLIRVYMLQFRGYLAPITVMPVIRTAFIGAVFGHMTLGLDLTMPASSAWPRYSASRSTTASSWSPSSARSAGGLLTIEAAKQAGCARFRPIMLTSITTVIGLTSRLVEKSLQAQILIPLAASLAFGLVTATIAALFLVPALYVILDDFGPLGALAVGDGKDLAVGEVGA